MINLRLISLVSLICSIIILSINIYQIGNQQCNQKTINYLTLGTEIPIGVIFVSLLILYFVQSD